MPPRSDSLLTAGDDMQLLRAPDGRYVLLTLESGRAASVGTYDHVADVWAALDRCDAA